MTELYIDGHRIDIEPGQIRQTFQNNTLGEVKDRQLSYTNSFKALNTGNNQRFFGHLQDINNQSDAPYRYLPAKIVEDGLEVSVGTAIIRKSNDDHVEVYIYSGINGLYESINNKSIRDLDWSRLNHSITEGIVTGSFDGSQGYIYALCDQTNLTNRQAYLEYWLPSVYEHWIFNKIFEEAGYEYEGDIFATDGFKAPVINPVTYDPEQDDLLVREFEKFMPDILQTEFIREILVRYGLMFDKVRNQKKYSFKQMKEIFRDRGSAVDWSKKLVSINDVLYTLGDYGARNYFRYADVEGYGGSADGYFELDIENLPQQITVHQSIYSVNQRVNFFDVLKFPIFEFDDDENMEVAEINPTISTIEEINGAFQFQSDGGFGTVFNGDVPYLRFKDLNYSKFTLENYFELKQVGNRAKVLDATLYLDPIDIYRLDFTKLVYMEQLSSYFYLNNIGNFISGRTCRGELVRIPPNVFSGQEEVNTAPIVQLFAKPNPVDEDKNITFTHNVADAEGNVESWILQFGDGQSVSGFGLPPQSITHQYGNSGNYTATLTVTDFEGLQGSASVNIVVNDTFVTTFNSSTGEYNAPPGSTVIVTATGGGAGDGSGTFGASTTEGGLSDLGGDMVTFPGPNSTKQFVFVMPSNGTAWFDAALGGSPSGSTAYFVQVTINNNGEMASYSVSYSNPNFP